MLEMYEITQFLINIQQLLSNDSQHDDSIKNQYIQIYDQLSSEQQQYFIDVLKQLDVSDKLRSLFNDTEKQNIESKSENKLESQSGFLSLSKLALSFENKGDAEKTANNLLILFENLPETFKYLDAYAEKKPKTKKFFNDAFSFILPETTNKWNIESRRLSLGSPQLCIKSSHRSIISING